MNLPTHLRKRIKQQAIKESDANFHPDVKGFENDVCRALYLAGASFLYSILKEEKGEVGRWVKASERVPGHSRSVHVRYTRDGINCAWTVRYFPAHNEWITQGSEGILEATDIEWLDTETPVVAGCGEAIEILKELCELKKHKDTAGKTSFYEERQPELWKKANEFLNSLV